MNKFITTISILLAFSFLSLAQSPNAISYQAIVRDNGGQIIKNQSVSFQFSIIEKIASGTAVYKETHTLNTNDFGLVDLRIGNGTSADDFNAIKWGSNEYFLKVEIDENGGSSYTDMGTTQIVSVPHALYANKSGGVNVLSQTEIDALIPMRGNMVYNTTSKQLEIATMEIGTPTIDQSMIGARTSGNQLNASFPASGQSFTAGSNGQLTSVDISLYNITVGGDFTLTIYEGAGFNGNSLGMVTQALTTSDAGVQTFDLSSQNINLKNGSVYTWKISVSGSENAAVYRSGNNYPGGISHIYTGGAAGCCDLYFVTKMASSSLKWSPIGK